MTQQVDTRTRARDEFARLLAERGYLGVSLAEAAVAQPLPPEVALPAQERPAPTPCRQLAQDVVDLFLYGAAPDRLDM
ncbi:hypothetical protein ACBR40_05510 [Nonomuraea sp. AD125B]|uniref:hypothetical protein n=1 Tax=Nonomuraea sp. AD125B TaxID=3242897 RepID=UPI0035293BD3